MSAGAYGFVMASNYNSRPLPAEVLVRGKSSPSFASGKPMRTSFAVKRILNNGGNHAWSSYSLILSRISLGGYSRYVRKVTNEQQ